jgi:hypothetical protein
MGYGPTNDPASMSTDAVNEILEGLASAVGEFTAAPGGDIAVAEVPDADADYDRSDPRRPRWPDPQRALRQALSQLVSEARRRREELTREFAAWWADLASVAVYDTAAGIPVQVVRAAVGDPSLHLSDEDLHFLPGTSFRGEQLVIADEVAPDRRRDQLWGADWTDHRVPPLPPAAELSERLAACGTPEDRIAEVRRARKAIAEALDASQRLRQDPDNEALLERAEQLTGLLIDYARLLTDTLREMWSATP